VNRLASAFLAVAVSTVGFVALPAAPAHAAGTILLGRIQYDPPGTDSGSNTHLNTEYVIIRNTGGSTRSLTGWTLRDRQAHTYTFGTFSLAAGAQAVVRTGKGTNSAVNRYWGRGPGTAGYVWNNTGDAATLRTNANVTVDSCSWGDGPGYIYC
jgi:hypothetical protein